MQNAKKQICIYAFVYFTGIHLEYGASSLCWPRLHFDLPNQILRFRPPKCGRNRSAPQTPSKNAIKYICKKGTFFWRHQDVLHPMAEYSSTPKGYSSTPGVPLVGPLSGKTWATTRVGDRHSAIRAPRSGRILIRRDPIFELVNTVVKEVRKRAFSAPAIDLVCRRPRCGKRKTMAMCAPFDIDDNIAR